MTPFDAYAESFRKAKEGDVEAFGEFVDGTRRALVRYIEQQCGLQRADAEGVASEVYYLCWKARESIHSIGLLRSWMCTVAMRHAMRFKQSRARDMERLEAIARLEARRAERSGSKTPRTDYLSILERREKRMLLLRLERGLSAREISERVGLTRRQVEYALEQCLAKLKRRFFGDDPR